MFSLTLWPSPIWTIYCPAERISPMILLVSFSNRSKDKQDWRLQCDPFPVLIWNRIREISRRKEMRMRQVLFSLSKIQNLDLQKVSYIFSYHAVRKWEKDEWSFDVYSKIFLPGSNIILNCAECCTFFSIVNSTHYILQVILLIVSANLVEVSFVGSEKFSVALDIDITCLINHSRCVWRGLSQRKERKWLKHDFSLRFIDFRIQCHTELSKRDAGIGWIIALPTWAASFPPLTSRKAGAGLRRQRSLRWPSNTFATSKVIPAPNRTDVSWHQRLSLVSTKQQA